MFSTLDLAAAKQSYFTTGHGHYSPTKSEVSFELSQMAAKDRGEILEVMIADYFNRHGIESQRSDTQDYDLDAFVGGRHIRIEVKSAMKAKATGKYCFQNIKPENFDMLFLVFIDPDNGPQVRTVSKRDVNEFTTRYTRHHMGYTMGFKDIDDGPVLTSQWDIMYNNETVKQ
tara:strand:- start:91 stop:606 length:516 start_codon:yes stop_codon:yes gene_type:complete